MWNILKKGIVYKIIFLMLAIILLFLFYRNNSLNGNLGGNDFFKKPDKDLNNFISIYMKGKDGGVKIIFDKRFKDCISSNYYSGFSLLSSNIIERKVKLPDKIFNCIRRKAKLSTYVQKEGEYIVDRNGILHILNSNVNLKIEGYKIYGHSE